MDKKKKIELQVLHLSDSRERADAYTLVLDEKNGKRQLQITIGAAEAQAMLIELRGIVPPRPLTHHLFASVLEVLWVRLMRVLIYRVENGVFYSYLYLKADEAIVRVDARTSDAILLALRMKAPILIYEEILDAKCLTPDKRTTGPTGGLAPEEDEFLQEEKLEMLKKALQDAIDEENYELAAKLRDQINLTKNNL